MFAHHSIRSTLWIAFFAMILASWWVLYAMAMRMGLNWYGVPVDVMDMAAKAPLLFPSESSAMSSAVSPSITSPATPTGSLLTLVSMWAIMMVAMMGPTFVATLATYEALIKSANGSRAGWCGVVLGYFIVWAAFGVVFASLQAGLMRFGWLNGFGMLTEQWAVAGLLIIVGWFQFTWIKEVCHGVCHGPMQYFLGNWRPGGAGGVRMGLGLGAYCVVCCWGYMALGFAGGAMNLLWMGGATVLMVLEKLPQVAVYVMRPVGVAMIAAGVGFAGRAAGIY